MVARHDPAKADQLERSALSQRLDALMDLSLYDLRQQWRRLYRMQPPARLSRDLLTRGIAYRLQEQQLGGLPKAVRRRLAAADPAFARPGAGRSAPLTIKPGTRLVRQWRGVTHIVLVGTDHVEWNGQCYRSLSEVARAITGARWSGPRFFGLRQRMGATEDKAGRGGQPGLNDAARLQTVAGQEAGAHRATRTLTVAAQDGVGSDADIKRKTRDQTDADV